MEEKNQLLNIPIPFYDESLKGLIIRACMLNKYNMPLWLYELANLKACKGPIHVNYIDESKLEMLAEMLNIKVDMLSTLTFSNVFKDCEATIKKFQNI